MEYKIAVPTDNIYKFYALFGLLLLVAGFAGSIYNTKSTNEFMASAVVELAATTALEAPTASQQARKQILERLVEVNQSDKNFFDNVLAGLIAIAMLLMLFGFWKWHTVIQPKQDALFDLQLKKLKLEVLKGSKFRLGKPVTSDPNED